MKLFKDLNSVQANESGAFRTSSKKHSRQARCVPAEGSDRAFTTLNEKARLSFLFFEITASQRKAL